MKLLAELVILTYYSLFIGLEIYAVYKGYLSRSRTYMLGYSPETVSSILYNYSDEKRRFYITLTGRDGQFILYCSSSHTQGYSFVMTMKETGGGTCVTIKPKHMLTSSREDPNWYLKELERVFERMKL